VEALFRMKIHVLAYIESNFFALLFDLSVQLMQIKPIFGMIYVYRILSGDIDLWALINLIFDEGGYENNADDWIDRNVALQQCARRLDR
jgi:hypothetical protein